MCAYALLGQILAIQTCMGHLVVDASIYNP